MIYTSEMSSAIKRAHTFISVGHTCMHTHANVKVTAARIVSSSMPKEDSMAGVGEMLTKYASIPVEAKRQFSFMLTQYGRTVRTTIAALSEMVTVSGVVPAECILSAEKHTFFVSRHQLRVYVWLLAKRA